MVLQRMRLESGVKIRGVRGDVVAHKAHAFAGIENTCRGVEHGPPRSYAG
jgi:hypothetical protein